MDALIAMQGICKHYTLGGQTVRALDGVNFTVRDGEMVAILGPSGSGKSTLMNILGCLDTPTAGTYRLAGQAVEQMTEGELSRVRGRTVGFVFQGFHLLPGLTARENVELPLVYRGIPEEERRRLAQESLQRVGLAARMDHRPGELSGGQQQRAFLARALAQEAHILLLDEPFTGLDVPGIESLATLLRALAAEGRLIIASHHDLSTAAQIFDRSLLLNRRAIAYGSTAEVLSESNLLTAFGERRLTSTP